MSLIFDKHICLWSLQSLYMYLLQEKDDVIPYNVNTMTLESDGADQSIK
jgi:hypothetical protein